MPRTALTPLIGTLYELQAAYVEPHLKAMGLSWAAFQVLSAVQAAGKQASQAEVARRIGVTPATLSEAVAEHVKQGLLKQSGSTSDRRMKILQLSAKGEKLLVQVLKVAQDAEAKMLVGIGETSLSTCATTLSRCIANLEKCFD